MRANLHFVLYISIFFTSFCGLSQEKYWKSVVPKAQGAQQTKAEKSALFDFDEKAFQEELRKENMKTPEKLIYFPTSTGALIGFMVKETPIFHPDLAKKYPDIKSYTGWSEDKKHKIRFSSSPKGIQGMLVSVTDESRATFIEKDKNTLKYIAYEESSRFASKDGFICTTEDLERSVSFNRPTSSSLIADQTLRTYRIAVSATGEYTEYHGGSVADALAAINATLTRVNEVFETDLGVHLELIANNDLVIFTDPATDPYTRNLNGQVQSTLTAIIGEANYDVGHLFQSSNNGGNAGFIGSVCSDNRKGSAFSSGEDPEGDAFDLDFVAHELGHQFGANHTWSFESENTGVQVEPASGTTLMGYAGIVPGNDVQPNSDDYFHYSSIVQITEYLETTSCAQTTSLTNSPPVISPVPNYSIPKGTAFVLAADVTDVDSADVLTYTWEQIDDGIVVTSTFGPENTNGANFRSEKPTTNPERYFPKLARIVQGNLTQTNPAENSVWETVATIEREFNFAFTARDNATGGGQVASVITKINTINAAGPFVVTSQTSNEDYQAGSIQEITWDVANTDKAPINAQAVDVLLSIDGGLTFPLLIADDIPNTGSAEVQFPGNATNSARIMVRAANNIFLAVNTSDFSIQESEVVLNFQDLNFETCQPNDIVIPFSYETFAGFTEQVDFTAEIPMGLSASFSPNTATDNGTAITLTLTNTSALEVGSYPVTIIGTSASLVVENTITINIYNTSFSNVILLSPADLDTTTMANPLLQWEPELNSTQYDVEIATDEAFATIIETNSVDFEFYQPTSLLSETTYFWRIRPRNACVTGNFGIPFSFSTSPITCTTLDASGLPLSISPNGMSTITTTLSVLQDLPIADIDVNLEIEHSFLEDLVIRLTSPAGTTITLFSKNCGSLNDIAVIFDDEGQPVSCSNASPAVGGTVQPLGSLASFNGESTLGDWILEVEDTFDGDGGSLDSFSLAFCVEGILRPDDDEDGVFDDGDDLCLGTPKGVSVDITGCPINRFAADNFNIKVQSESCRNNNDGAIIIEAIDETISYTATLVGINSDFNGSFADVFSFENLLAGNYRLCITGTKAGITFEESCFDIVIEEPEVLTVTSALTANSLQAVISLQGASLYNVEVNGVVTQTENSEISIDLKPGVNELNVFTNLPCQGNFKESLFVATSALIYPNPVQDKLTVFLNQEMENAAVQLFDSNGGLVYQTAVNIQGASFELDFEAFPAGIYFLRITGRNLKEEFKVLKR